MINKSCLIFSSLMLFVIVSCGDSKPKPQTAPVSEIPIWITAPQIEGGIAATRCVAASKSISIDQSQTSALARAELSRQLENRVEVMDKIYEEKISTNKGDAIGSNFSSVSRQLSSNALKGSRPVKATYVTIDGKKHFCTMVGLDPAATDKLIDSIIKGGTTDSVSQQDKDVLYQEFKAYKAQQELQEALGN